MTWTKLSDDFADDCWTLSDAAFRLHVDGLTWSARKLLDLRIPADDLPRCSKRPEAVTELLAVGWWSADGDGYVIRHHAVYQRSRDQVLSQQEANAANGRRGGRPPKASREQAADLTPETQSVSDWVSGSVPAADQPPPGSVSAHAQETQSVSESLSDSKSERDGTGQDRLITGTELEVVAPAPDDDPPPLDPVRCYDPDCRGECGDEWHTPTARARWANAAVLYEREAAG